MSNYTHTGIRISIGVILLFCLLLTINVWGAVITVGPSGCNYTTIQGAINNASTGDTIEVMSATYPESLVVDRSVTITGIIPVPATQISILWEGMSALTSLLPELQ